MNTNEQAIEIIAIAKMVKDENVYGALVKGITEALVEAARMPREEDFKEWFYVNTDYKPDPEPIYEWFKSKMERK